MIKYYGFEVEDYNGAKLGHERIADMVEELRILHAEHFQETETLYLESPFDPDYRRYIWSEKENQFVVFTARRDGKMIGYLQYYIFRDMHSQGMMTAREDAFFFTKAHRGGGTASRLLTYAEHCLKQLGCKYVGMSSKAPAGGPDIGKFLERKGYAPVALYYSKKL